LPRAEPRVLVAAIRPLAGEARLRARQVHAALRATHQVCLRRGLLFTIAVACLSQRAPDQPGDSHDKKDQDDQAAHHAII
jgi:hypothetical protein